MVPTSTRRRIGLSVSTGAGATMIGLVAIGLGGPNSRGPLGLLVAAAVGGVVVGLVTRTAPLIGLGHGGVAAAIVLAQDGRHPNLIVAGLVGFGLLGLLSLADRAIEPCPDGRWDPQDLRTRTRAAVRLGGVSTAAALFTGLAAVAGGSVGGTGMAILGAAAVLLFGTATVLHVRRVVDGDAAPSSPTAGA